MSAEENAAVFRRVVEEGFGQGDTAVIDEVVSPDFVEHEAGRSRIRVARASRHW